MVGLTFLADIAHDYKVQDELVHGGFFEGLLDVLAQRFEAVTLAEEDLHLLETGMALCRVLTNNRAEFGQLVVASLLRRAETLLESESVTREP